MNSVIEAIRAKYPQYDALPDDELTKMVGEKYPQYFEREDFGNDFRRIMGVPESITPEPEVWDTAPSAKSELALQKAQAEREGNKAAQIADVIEGYENVLSGPAGIVRQAEKVVESATGKELTVRPSEILQRPAFGRIPEIQVDKNAPWWKKAGAGVVNSASTLVNFLQTPEAVIIPMLPRLGPPKIAKPISQTVNIEYSGQLATQFPEVFEQWRKAYERGDVQAAWQYATLGLSSAAFSALMAKAALHEPKTFLEAQLKKIKNDPTYREKLNEEFEKPEGQATAAIDQAQGAGAPATAAALKAALPEAENPIVIEKIEAPKVEEPTVITITDQPAGEVETSKPAETIGAQNAIEKRPQPESNQPEYSGTDAQRTPAETGGSNRNVGSGNVPPEEAPLQGGVLPSKLAGSTEGKTAQTDIVATAGKPNAIAASEIHPEKPYQRGNYKSYLESYLSPLVAPEKASPLQQFFVGYANFIRRRLREQYGDVPINEIERVDISAETGRRESFLQNEANKIAREAGGLIGQRVELKLNEFLDIIIDKLRDEGATDNDIAGFRNKVKQTAQMVSQLVAGASPRLGQIEAFDLGITKNLYSAAHNLVRQAIMALRPGMAKSHIIDNLVQEIMTGKAFSQKAGGGKPKPAPVMVHQIAEPPKALETSAEVAPPAVTPEVKPAATEKPAVTPKKAQGKKVGGISMAARVGRETEITGPDIISWIVDNGKLLSKSAAKRKWTKDKWNRNKSEWDGAAPLESPHHNLIYSDNGSPPDQVANAAYRAGIIKEESVDALWDAIKGASKNRKGARARELKLENLQNQEADFIEHVSERNPGEHGYYTDEMNVGDKLIVDGVEMEIIRKDANTGELTLKDGKRFGVQVLPSGKKVYVEQFVEGEAVSGEFAPEEPKPTAPAIPRIPAGQKTGDLLANVSEPFKLVGEKTSEAKPAKVAPAEAPEMFTVQQAAATKDWVKGADDAIRIYGTPAKAIEHLQNQLRTIDSDPETAKTFSQEQRAGLKAVLSELQKRHGESPGPGAAGYVGMGGAVPGEFRPSGGTPIALKNASIEDLRVRRGLPKFEPVMREKFKDAWDNAMALIDRDPGIQDRLIAELRKEDRALKDVTEEALLQHRIIDLDNELSKAMRDMNQAYEDGRIQDQPDIQTRMDILSDALREATDMSHRAGTKWGQTGVARQQFILDDFTLAGLETRKRAVNGGRRLTPDEISEITKIHDEYEKKVKELQQHLDAETKKAADAEIARIEAETKAEKTVSPYHPSVLDYAEKWVKKLEAKAETEFERLKKAYSLGIVPKEITPRDWASLAIIGASKLARFGLNKARWATEMATKLGDWVKPHLDKLWDESNKALNTELASEKQPAKTAKVREIIKKKGEEPTPQERIETALDKIQNKFEKNELDDISPFVHKLVRSIVDRSPDITRDALVDEVHGYLKEFKPDITRLETMDAISGRGKWWTLDQGEISKKVRDLKTQIRLVGHQIDIEQQVARGETPQAPPRTGLQRDKMSDIARREEQKLNELKRRYGVVVTDPASQLASALQTRKTYLRNRMSDLRWEISNRKRIVKERSLPPSDAELVKMQEEYGKVKAEHAEIFGTRELTEKQRLEAAIRSVDRQITELEGQLEKGELYPQKTGKPPVESPALLEKKAWLSALREHRQELRDIANPKKTPLERALQSAKARMAKQLAEYQRRIAEGDFSPMKKGPKFDLSQDKETMQLKADIAKIKTDYQRGLVQDQIRRMSKGKRIYTEASEALHSSRNILSAFDVSAVLRQGGFLAFSHPLRAGKILGPMFRALASEKYAQRVEQEILHRPNAPDYARSKLFLPSINETRLTAQEEMIMSRWVQKIPGVRHSNRAFITFLNLLRADSFDALKASLDTWGRKAPDARDLEVIANFINIATGRGKLYKAEVAGEVLARVFWSPRLVASRFELLAGQPLWHGKASGATRALIAWEYAKTLGGIAVVLGLGALAGGTISGDPKSSDFLKMKFGNARLDPMFGLSQNTVLLFREITGKQTNQKGQTFPIRGKVPVGKPKAGDIFFKYVRSKFSPVLGSMFDLFSGENVVGETVTPKSALANMFTPLSFRDIYDVMLANGVTAGTAMGVLSLFGMGLQYYNPYQKKR